MKLGPEIVTVAYPKLRDECAIRPAGKQCVGNRSSYSARMVDGNSEHVAQAWRKIDLFEEKKNTICDCFRSNRKTWTDQITEIASYVCTHSELPSNISMIDTACPDSVANYKLREDCAIGFPESSFSSWYLYYIVV